MKKVLTTILVIGTILACMTPAFAAQRDVPVVNVTGSTNSSLANSAYIYDSINGNKIFNISGKTISLKFDAGTLTWVRSLYSSTAGDKRGYTPVSVLYTSYPTIRHGLFTTSTLKNGDRGSAVTNLQLCLYKGGFLTSSDVDGIFGNDTEQAVKDFQYSFGLTVDGLVGNDTKDKMVQEYINYDERPYDW